MLEQVPEDEDAVAHWPGPVPLAVPFGERRRALRAAVEDPQMLVVPGVSDALGARVVEKVGFEACYVTGAGIANAQFGVPDIGLVSMTEMVGQVRRIAHACGLPLLVDMDDGYGGPLTVLRAVPMFEEAGASGIQIEDQQAPKRCGHFNDHRLVSASEMQAKIDAAVRARSDENLLIVARTDAYGVSGIEEAISRGRCYVEAGADALFVEAPTTVEAMRSVASELAEVPLVINIVEGGKTPELSVAELGGMGFGVALFANFVLRRMAWAAESGLRHLLEKGETRSLAGEMTSWEDRQALARLPLFTELEEYFDARWPDGAGTRIERGGVR